VPDDLLRVLHPLRPRQRILNAKEHG
jgi:hypothetical protein